MPYYPPNQSSETAATILAKLLTVDGSGSGLDADLLDGNNSSYFLASSSYTAADVLAKLLTVDGASSGLDADTVDGLHAADLSGGASLTIDTRANILASTPSDPSLALSSDTLELFVFNGSVWYVSPLEFDVENTTPDIGAFNSDGLGVSDRQGYYSNVITDKVIHHTVIGHNDRTETGAIRVSGSELQVYLSGVWNAIVTGFRFIQDSTTLVGELEFRPSGYSNYYSVMTGNSNDTDYNGLPVIQQYTGSMGVYSAKLVIDGGSF